MSEPRWVREDVVYALHRRQLAEHGGSDGIRDAGLLASALHRPLNLWQYEDSPPDLPALAAAYAFGIARTHPFVDGDKRAAFVVCRTFLLLNGHDVAASQAEKYSTFLTLAEGGLSEGQLASWIRTRLVDAR